MTDFVVRLYPSLYENGFVAQFSDSFWAGLTLMAIFIVVPWVIGIPVAALVVRVIRKYWDMRDDSAAVVAIAWPIALGVLIILGLWKIIWYCLLLPFGNLILYLTGGGFRL